MKFTASQAAKETGKSIPTITRAIKSGKISAEKTPSGGYLIEPSELFRIFNPLTPKANAIGNSLDSETPYETILLQEKIKVLEAALSDIRDERDEWRNHAKRLSLALPSPDHREQHEKPRKWWKLWLPISSR